MQFDGGTSLWKALFSLLVITTVGSCLALILTLTIGQLCIPVRTFSLPPNSPAYIMAKYFSAQTRLFITSTVTLSSSFLSSLIGTVLSFKMSNSEGGKSVSSRQWSNILNIIFYLLLSVTTLNLLVPFGTQLQMAIQLPNSNPARQWGIISVIALDLLGSIITLIITVTKRPTKRSQWRSQPKENPSNQVPTCQPPPIPFIYSATKKQLSVYERFIPQKKNKSHIKSTKSKQQIMQDLIKAQMEQYNSRQPLMDLNPAQNEVANPCIFIPQQLSNSSQLQQDREYRSQSFKQNIPRLRIDLIKAQIQHQPVPQSKKNQNPTFFFNNLDISDIAHAKPEKKTTTNKDQMLRPELFIQEESYWTGSVLSQSKMPQEVEQKHFRPDLSKYRCDLPPKKEGKKKGKDEAVIRLMPVWVTPQVQFD